jgi:5-formyltetrahydrofolate cyclo-ligase
MKELRASIGPEERGRLADEIEGRLFALGQLDGTRTIMLFASFGSEVPTQGMIERALKDGRRVILPYLQEGEIHGAEIGGRRGMVRSSCGPKSLPRRSTSSSRRDLRSTGRATAWDTGEGTTTGSWTGSATRRGW